MAIKLNWGKWIFLTGIVATPTGLYLNEIANKVDKPEEAVLTAPSIDIPAPETIVPTNTEMARLTLENQTLKSEQEYNHSIIESLKKLVSDGLNKREELTRLITDLTNQMKQTNELNQDTINNLQNELSNLTAENGNINQLVDTLKDMVTTSLTKRHELQQTLNTRKCNRRVKR